MTVNARADAAGAPIRTLVSDGRFNEAWALVRPQLLSGEATAPWSVARNVLRAGGRRDWKPACTRSARVALLCTYEAAEL